MPLQVAQLGDMLVSTEGRKVGHDVHLEGPLGALFDLLAETVDKCAVADFGGAEGCALHLDVVANVGQWLVHLQVERALLEGVTLGQSSSADLTS